MPKSRMSQKPRDVSKPKKSNGMTFDQMFKSQEWQEILWSAKVNLPIVQRSSAEVDSLRDCSEIPRLVADADYDEQLILAQYREGIRPGNERPIGAPPEPGSVLYEFLESLGVREESFWRSLPIDPIVSVIDGHSKISARLSEKLSNILGTHEAYWVELQKHHDFWKSSKAT